jgi:hypothetical protein
LGKLFSLESGIGFIFSLAVLFNDKILLQSHPIPNPHKKYNFNKNRKNIYLKH